MMHLTPLLFSTILAAQGELRLVNREPDPPLAPGPVYAESLESALESIKGTDRLALLYFTASW